MNSVKFLSAIIIVIYLTGISEIQAENKLDSLLRIVSTQKDVIDKIENYIVIARIYSSIDPDSAIGYAEKALALSDQLGYDKGRLKAWSRLGYVYKSMGKYNTSYEYFVKMLELGQQTFDSSYIAKGYLELANHYRRNGKERLALYYQSKSKTLYADLDNRVGLLSNYNSMGNLFKNIASFDSAVYYYMLAISKVKEDERFVRHLITIYHNLGGTYKEMGDYKNAKVYLYMALDLANKLDDKVGLADVYTKLGNVSNEESDYDSAIYYYKLSEPLIREMKDERGLHDLYINYGIVFRNKGLYDLAHNNFRLALKYYRKQDFAEGMITAWQNIAKIYSIKGNYLSSFSYLDSCIRLARISGRQNEMLSSLDLSSDIYYQSGRYKKSHDFKESYINLKDSIYMLEREETIAVLNIHYKSELKQARIIALENENLKKTRQRNRYMFGGIGIISLSIFLILYLRLTARKNRIIAEQKIRQLEEEKKLLAARFLVEGQEEERKRIATELHDGLGVLLSATKMHFTSIKDTKPENKPLIEKATKFLEQASSDVRKISHNMMPGLLTKLGLCEALEDLFEKLDESEGVTATCQIKGARERLPENQEIMIYRIVQEMVNNTLKHAEAQKIELRIDVLPDKLDIRYADDGKGFNVEQMLEKKSIGLQSIKSRVRFLDGTVSIHSEPGKGTVYTMQIPVITDH